MKVAKERTARSKLKSRTETTDHAESGRLRFSPAAGNAEPGAADAEVCPRNWRTEQHCELETLTYNHLPVLTHTCCNTGSIIPQ